ncbi:hypothetical protein [Planomicrobium sp. CPCC 101110]|nr:hypothetical protein [Planomicrobium sp. CPCC 101110]
MKCLKGTFILEVTSSENQQVQHYTPADQAAEALYQRIRTIKAN